MTILGKIALTGLLPLIAAAAPSTTGPAPSRIDDAESRWLFVANQSAAVVTIIDMETNEIARKIDLVELGFTPDAKPHHIAVEPDGGFWYVSLIGDNVVLKFDHEDRLVGRTGFERPGMLALHPTEDLLFVGRSMAAVNPPQRVGLIRRSDMTIEEVDVFFPRPHAIAVHPDGAHLYTASLAENSLAAVDWREEELELASLGEGPPHVLVQFAISPDGESLIGTGQLTGKLLVFDVGNPMAPALRTTVDVNAAPWHPIFSPDGRFVYFGNQNSNTVTIVETAGWTVDAVIEGEGLAEPHGIAVSSDGSRVYVSNRNLKGEYAPGSGDAHPGTVVVIDAASREIVHVIETDGYAAGMDTGPAR